MRRKRGAALDRCMVPALAAVLVALCISTVYGAALVSYTFCVKWTVEGADYEHVAGFAAHCQEVATHTLFNALVVFAPRRMASVK